MPGITLNLVTETLFNMYDAIGGELVSGFSFTTHYHAVMASYSCSNDRIVTVPEFTTLSGNAVCTSSVSLFQDRKGA